MLKNISVRVKIYLLLLFIAIAFFAGSMVAVKSLNKQTSKFLTQFEKTMYQDIDTQLKEQTESACSMLNGVYEKYQNGEYSLKKAKKVGADLLRSLRYGDNGYFYADTLEGKCVVLLGNDTEGTYRGDAKDSNGVRYIQKMKEAGMQDGGGYVDLMFPKDGETEPSLKRNYTLLFEPFGWIVGTGSYVDDVEEAVAQEKELFNENNLKIRNTLIGFSVVSIIIIIIIALIIIIPITRGLGKLTKVTEKLAAGDMNVSVDITGKDEIGRLAQSFRKLTDKLNTYVDYIDEVSLLLERIGEGDLDLEFKHSYDGEFVKLKSSLTKTIEMLTELISEIQDTSKQIVVNSEHFSDASQLLADGAATQATAVQEISSTVTDLSVRVEHNAENTVKTKSISSETNKQVSSQNDKMENMLEAMVNIRDKSNEIKKIIKSIDDIAFQTNILALNAAVEAARAGAAGHGFAVVADEVRNLAIKSAEAANESTQYIEASISAVNDGVQLAENAAKSIADVMELSEQNNTIIKDITEKNEEQAVAIKEVSTGLEQILDVVQRNSATARENAASSANLDSQAQHLSSLVDQFNI